MLKSLMKAVLILSSLGFASANFAADKQPLQLAQADSEFNVEATYMQFCNACHAAGVSGAPKVGPGNAEEWATRLEKGREALLSNAINGVGMMPPRGICMNCTDEQLDTLIQYMIDSSTE